MSKDIKKPSKKAGLPPGSLVYIGKHKTGECKITLITYNAGDYEEKECKDVEECQKYLERNTVTWINIDGVHQTQVIEKTGSLFNLHHLVLEDILNTHQRPKAEDYTDYIFFTLKIPVNNGEKNKGKYEQISFILGKKYVISFQETEGDIFGPVRERIRNGTGKVRKEGADFLFYLLIDSVIDNYFLIIENLGEAIEPLEEKILKVPTVHSFHAIQTLKKELIYIRKNIFPVREAINSLIKRESALIEDKTIKYLGDSHDHTILMIDYLETYRDLISGLKDIYMSSISNRMNATMKTLTIISTIFIPLTFIAGIYGMNFEVMPELKWQWGYLMIWVVIVLIAVVMLIYFKRKKWF